MSSSFLTGSLADLSSFSNVFYITVFHKSASSGNFSLISYGKPPFWMFWAAREAGSIPLPAKLLSVSDTHSRYRACLTSLRIVYPLSSGNALTSPSLWACVHVIFFISPPL